MYTTKQDRRWTFPERLTALSFALTPPGFLRHVFWRRAAQRFVSCLYPDNCRLCEHPLREVSRIPVCADCLRGACEPFSPEYACAGCRMPFRNHYPLDSEGLCGLCRAGARGFDAAYAFGSYEGSLRRLIHLFKYGQVESLRRPLGELLARAWPRDQRFDVIVPLPLHWRKRWQRGFNQSEHLARELSRRTGVPVQRAVRRVAGGAVQAGLSHAQRRTNVASAFRACTSLAGKHVLLIDDVLTTGATASACGRELKRAGAARVTVLTVARVDRRLGITD